jgi:hypothetical protein
MWMVCLPDYGGTKHAVVGPFPDKETADAWGRLNVGSARSWFSSVVTAPDDYVAR